MMNAKEHKVLLSLGSNQGDRRACLLEAIERIDAEIAPLFALSSIYETTSWAYDDHDYLNMTLCILSSLDSTDLMNQLLALEKDMGRIRTEGEGYRARPIDIDILLVEDVICDTELLTVPHPRMHQRRFVLEPLVEIAPDWIHEKMERSISELLEQCDDNTAVKFYEKISLHSHRG
jgi:2-amino-4-hydroxy-6-hydroxymethyldihydropteridine diphosphokinase